MKPDAVVRPKRTDAAAPRKGRGAEEPMGEPVWEARWSTRAALWQRQAAESQSMRRAPSYCLAARSRI
jgi:hypothetical protein